MAYSKTRSAGQSLILPASMGTQVISGPEAQVMASGPIAPTNGFLYWKAYFNFYYYVGFSPFRFKYLKVAGRYVIQEGSRARKTSCVIMHCLTGLVCLSLFRSCSPALKFREDPMQLFQVINSGGFVFLYVPVLAHLIWTKPKYLGRVLQYCQQGRSKGSGGPAGITKESVFSYGSVGTLALVSTAAFYYSVLNSFLVPLEENSALGVLKANAGLLQYNLFLRPNKTSISFEEELPIAWGVASVLYILLSHYAITVAFLVEAVPVLTALFLRSVSINFSRILERDGSDYKQILDEYTSYKELVRNINRVTSVGILVNFICSFPYYPFQLVQIIDGEDITAVFIMAGAVAYVITAAEASRRFGQIKRWLLNADAEVMERSRGKLTLLYIEATGSPLGLQGGGMFTINYKTIGTGLSLLATYLVIVLQFSAGSNSKTNCCK